jgi:hypothetical protein
VRGDNAREAAERFVTEDDELSSRITVGGVPVDVSPGWGQSVAPLVRQLRRAVEELARERDEEADERAMRLARIECGRDVR